MADNSYPKLIIDPSFNEQDSYNISLKGWFSADIEIEDGTHFKINFFDPIRLKQEYDDSIREGEPCFIEFNLIIIPKITIENIQDCIQFLWKKGYFSYIKAEY